ncbi:hypothetical protein LTR36_002656 [Oleoguttula mirabilis]|uniref:cyclin-dependent kinase n=1 Tax=Oleoguttula mirabilis TaxID=1507867 RepID=A0AAV9JKI1_9PEZI|nr:hypothetical protein LTR36_002656 [Oleoguttula mirabilis]
MTAISEGAELVGESGKTYLAVGSLGQENVWTAVERDDPSNIVVLKAPAADDTSEAWPHFQQEMIMHELLKDCSAIRKQVDRIPPVEEDGSPPILVLEIFETTLWQARTKRPFSKGEVQSVSKSILQGLKQVHDKGLVYVDLKMENVMLSGFDTSAAGDGSKLVTKLGDLGIVMEPANGKSQPVAYRAPEVFFKGDLAPPADIWAFGLIYSHLLEARRRFSNTGLYDDLYIGGGSMGEREQAMRFAIANDYDIRNVEYYKDCALPYRDETHLIGQQWDELRKRGINESEIEFLQWVLTTDPGVRPTAQAILDSHWFNAGSGASKIGSSVDGAAEIADGQAGTTVPFAAISYDRSKTASGTGPPKSIEMPATKILNFGDMQRESAFTPTGSGAFDQMLHKRKASGSPIKEHPLVLSAMSQGLGGDGMEKSATERKPEHAAADTPQRLESLDDEKGGSATSGAESTTPTTDATTASGIPDYMGRKASSGGTYLSYQ